MNKGIKQETIEGLKVKFDDKSINEILSNIKNSLQSGRLYQDKLVKKFEEEFANYHNVKFGIAVNSGLSAIEIPLQILNIHGKEVIIPTNTFIATALGIIRAGGIVKLADTAPNKLTPGLKEIQDQFTARTCGVIIVHIGGYIPDDIEEIRSWCKSKGIFLYEDAAHAHGSSLNKKHAGEFGIAAGFSLFATKVITSGEGGIILTNNSEINQRARQIRNYGKSSDWGSENTEIGGNFRMSEITAAIALQQTKNLSTIINKRKRIAELYKKLIKSEGLDVTLLCNDQVNNYYKLIIILPKQIESDTIRNQFSKHGISLPGSVYQTPLHKQPIAKKLNLIGKYPNSEYICKHHISLPIYPSLKDSSIYKVVECLKNILIE